MKKYLMFLLFFFAVAFPISVSANIVCNDGSISTTCGDCHRGCCSHHGGCSSRSTDEIDSESTSKINEHSKIENKIIESNNNDTSMIIKKDNSVDNTIEVKELDNNSKDDETIDITFPILIGIGAIGSLIFYISRK